MARGGKRTVLSGDLRERIVKTSLAGEGSEQALGVRFGVSAAVVGKLVRQYRETGSYESLLKNNGGKSALTLEQIEALRQHLIDEPDATVLERKAALNLPGCEQTIWKHCRDLGWRYKKSRSGPSSRTARTSRQPGRSGKRRSR